LLLARALPAQTFTTLHSFLGGTEGAGPSGLILSSDILFGTTTANTSSNASWDAGTIFSTSIDGSGFTNLHSFAAFTDNDPADGTGPRAPLLLSGDTLYGTTLSGGSSSNGIVFSVSSHGTGFTILHSFTAAGNLTPTNSDGIYPRSGLVLSGDTLFGTAELGGGFGKGTIFSLKTDGSAFTVLHTFDNVDGNGPVGGLILSDHTLFGAAGGGGPSGAGTIFSINTNGTGFTNLHSFSGRPDGHSPNGRLILSDGILYGTTGAGGASNSNSGTVFSIRNDGTGFTTLHSFTPNSNGGITIANVDGAWPFAGLVLCGDTLYGTAHAGGPSRSGTVFGLKTNGSDFTVLHGFTNSDGVGPNSDLILLGSTLYGTTDGGGSGYGTIFAVSLAPELTVTPSRSSVVLTWPTNFTGYALQSTANLISPVWTTNFPTPVVFNGLVTVTNPISGTQQFFRLSQ